MCLCVVGDVDPELVLRRAEEILSQDQLADAAGATVAAPTRRGG